MIQSDAVFLGPNGENAPLLLRALERILGADSAWRATVSGGETLAKDNALEPALTQVLDRLISRFPQQIPFHHPRYMAQMIHDGAIPALTGLFAFLLNNPNNHAFEGGPVTTELELDVVRQFLGMFGFAHGWGHLTSGGTAANLEAAYIARCDKGMGAIIASKASHFAWKRIAHVLGMPFIDIEVDDAFRIDLDDLEQALKHNATAVVVANLGSTGSGSIDAVSDIAALQAHYGFHCHIDAAYGGYLPSLLRHGEETLNSHPLLSPYVTQQLLALAKADSITLDPHKHGLSTYGCGAVVYRDKALARHHAHDAPYTYAIEDRPNLGLYSLEGSRAGAQAASQWVVQQLFPLTATGMGRLIGQCLKQARHWHQRLAASAYFVPLHSPDIDIVVFSHRDPARNSALLEQCSVQQPEAPLYLSKFLWRGEPKLRCVFMKPLEIARSPDALDELFDRMEALA